MTTTTSSTSPIFTPTTAGYKNLGELISQVCGEIFSPPERLTPPEAAEKYVYINVPGAYVGKYNRRTTPYMDQPSELCVSFRYKGIIFVGSAQSGKTQSLVVNFAGYSIKCDPMDMIIFSPTLANARDFSTRRIGRMQDYSPEIKKMLKKERDSDNKFDKHYSSGMMLSLSWPSSAEFAGRPIGRVVITDRDRMDDNIEGEGEPFDLGQKRTTTFGSFAITVCESSPSRPIRDPKWVRHTKHEAPPCGGILELYNRGDRRRFYWPCPKCGEYFEGNFRMLTWDKMPDDYKASLTVVMNCPSCKHKIVPDDRYEMLQLGKWVLDGQGIDKEGNLIGDEPMNDIASFWLNGVAAAFISWPELVRNFIKAENSFERTGDESALIKFYNNDLAEAYLPKSMEQQRHPEVMQMRAEPMGSTADRPTVPHGVRFLVASIDVQKNMFIVQVHGILPGTPFDMVLVDRFRIHLSADRMDADEQVEWIKPGTYEEDWDLITAQVLEKTYPLGDDSGRRMSIRFTVCDSGGQAGVTANAYAYYRKLRSEGKAARFLLVKGDPSPGAPRVRTTYPDSNNTKVKAAAQGDVPVLLMASNQIKDMLNNRLESLEPGKGMIRFPDWLPDWWYAELCVEQRTDKGWEKPPHTRNEAWDLLYYCIAICISPYINAENLTWSSPKGWYADWDNNSLVSQAGKPAPFAVPSKPSYDIAALAKALA